MLSCLNGALEYYRTTGDEKILQACLNAWQDIVEHRLYPTGAASYREFFHGDYDLPSVSNVGETCVTVTWLQFNAQLLRLTGEARFAEQLERVVLNQLFGAQCPNGTAWGYYVQMEGKKPYSDNLYGHCCLSSGPRGVALIPTFAVTTDEDGVIVNLYDAGRARVNLHDGTTVTVITETLYPSEDKIRMTMQGFGKKEFGLKLRIPAWCKQYDVLVNNSSATTQKSPDGYELLRRTWQKGDQVQLRLKLEPHLLVGDHKNEDRVALMYGPLVLAADEALLTSGSVGLQNIGVSGPDLAKMKVTSETATGAYQTWPGARTFRIEGVERNSSGTVAGAKPVSVELVPFADAGATSSTYKVWLPYGKPRADGNLLYNGIESRSRKPSSGSAIDGDLSTIASTQGGNKAAQQDWFAVDLEEPVSIRRIVYVHGRTTPNGGWFDATAGKPRVEIRTAHAGPWQQVGTLDEYPNTTSAYPSGLTGGKKFTLLMDKPVDVYGVRIVGKPAGGQTPNKAFVTCAELQAFGDVQ
jgi:hypothetical protein